MYLLGERCLSIVVRSIVVDLIELIGLPEPVPRPEVAVIDIYSCPITLNGCISVFHLEILVTH